MLNYVSLLLVFFCLGTACSQPGDPVLQCLEEFVTTDPYQANFAALEQALIAEGRLESGAGQAYRKMVEQVREQDDLGLLLPATVQFEALPEAHYCYTRAAGTPPQLLAQLLQTMDSVRKAPNLYPSLILGAFLHNFTEADWDHPLTRHLFYSYLAQQYLVDNRILVKLPPWSDEEPDLANLKSRNIFTVLVNAENQVLIREEQVELSAIRALTKTFITNPEADPDLAESPRRAIISLRNERGTSYKTYLAVYNELKAAYLELWDEYCQDNFGYPYRDDLPLEVQKQIKSAIPFVISEAEPTDLGEE